MATWRPDPTFYPSPKMAMDAPREELAYVAILNPNGNNRPTRWASWTSNPASSSYSQIVGRLDLPNVGDELHHFGWNACSAALCPNMPHPHVERRYLLVPGLRSSRMYIVDTQPDPKNPKIVKTIEPDELMTKSGYSRPHTIHCGPDAIYVSALGAPGRRRPGRYLPDGPQTSRSRASGRRTAGRSTWPTTSGGTSGHDVMITSEWGTPNMVENGVNPELLLGVEVRPPAPRLGHAQAAATCKRWTSASEHQMVLELRPSHDPNKEYGFVGVVTSLEDLSASIWLWHRDNGAVEDPEGDHDPGRAGRSRRCCRRCSRASAPCRRW